MTGASNFDAATRRYVERMAKLYSQIADLTEDIKQVGIEAKAEGLQPEMLKRWAKAIATDRAEELAAKTVLQQSVGEIVAGPAFDKLAQPEPPRASASPGVWY